MKQTASEKARAQILKVNQIYRVYRMNSKAGQKFSFEYLRYIIEQKKYMYQLLENCK